MNACSIVYARSDPHTNRVLLGFLVQNNAFTSFNAVGAVQAAVFGVSLFGKFGLRKFMRFCHSSRNLQPSRH